MRAGGANPLPDVRMRIVAITGAGTSRTSDRVGVRPTFHGCRAFGPCTIDGRPWTKQPFPYQRKCLAWLREAYTALPPADRTLVGGVLRGTGCAALCAG
jgi:hypothetical protein